MANEINEEKIINEAMTDPEITKRIEEKLSTMQELDEKLMARVAKITPVHESLVTVEKLDLNSISTMLELPDNSRFDRIRMSFYGRVLMISDVNSGDSVQEAKKKRMKVGDLVSFNPDSAYSLNITIPDRLPEIWVVAVDNILMVDSAFDYAEAKKKSIIDRAILDVNRERNIAAKMQEHMKKQIKDFGKSNLVPIK